MFLQLQKNVLQQLTSDKNDSAVMENEENKRDDSVTDDARKAMGNKAGPFNKSTAPDPHAAATAVAGVEVRIT